MVEGQEVGCLHSTAEVSICKLAWLMAVASLGCIYRDLDACPRSQVLPDGGGEWGGAFSLQFTLGAQVACIRPEV